ncbi:MAG: response regulator, partial [Gallionellaceae bacterium]
RVLPCTLDSGLLGLQMSIIDNGIGISQEVLATLFQPFSQADESTARKFGGTGLGLSISQRLVELMSGTISVHSTLGNGAEFVVKLPLKEALPDGVAEVEPSLVGVCVLAVSCDEVIWPIVSAYCRAAGAEVIAFDGLQAVRAHLKQSSFARASMVVLLGSAVTTPVNKLDLPASIGLVRLLMGDGVSQTDKEVRISARPLLCRELINGVALACGRIMPLEPLVQNVDRRIQTGTKVLSVAEALLEGRLILLAEDNETNREVMQAQLHLLGYTAEVAEDGVAALEMWRSGNYALLLTDCHMPNMDGFELTTAIRQSEIDGVRKPIVAVTANAMHGESQRCLDRGMDDYLSKPLRLNELKSMLNKWLPLGAETVQIRRNDVVEELAIKYVEDAESTAAIEEVQSDCLVTWDATTLPRLMGDNPVMHERLLGKFLISAQAQIAAMDSAAANTEINRVADVAHKLKSAARTVGAIQLGELCQQIETTGRDGDSHICVTLVGTLNETFFVAEKLIKAHLAVCRA